MCVSGTCSHCWEQRGPSALCLCLWHLSDRKFKLFWRDSPLKWNFQVCGNQERVCYLAWHCYAINCVKSSRFERPPFRNKLHFPHEYINLPLFIYLSQMFLLGGFPPLIFRYSPGKPESESLYLPREPSRWRSCSHTQPWQKKLFFVAAELSILAGLGLQNNHHNHSSSIPAALPLRLLLQHLRPWLRQAAPSAWVSVLFLQVFVNLCVSLGGKKNINSSLKPLGNAWHSLSPSHSLFFGS